MLKRYYHLTKPGIIYGNLLNASAGFLLASASAHHYNVILLLATMAGIALIIASACVINNYIDRGIDKHMARTKHRCLVTGEMTSLTALTYATVLGVCGFAVLALGTNKLTVLLGFIAIFTYIVPYSITKRKTVYGTVVGSIAGALPPVAAYTAVTGRFDGAALLLLLIFTLWQMPHFYAIATFRAKEYAAAGLPVLPVKQGTRVAKIQSCVYIGAFIVANILLSFYGYTNTIYAIVLLLVGLMWLYKGLQGFKAKDDIKWGGSLFGFSLQVVLVLDVMLALGALLP